MAAVTVVAELGVNHDGSPEKARLMIDAAAGCGCDAVKVQSFRCADFLPEEHPDWVMFERCEIWPWLEQLSDHAHRRGLLFGVTPQSAESVQEAVDAGADYLKVGSDCLTHTRLIRAALESGLPVWMSTGMATEDEIGATPDRAKLMLCTSMYPCPDEQVGLARLASTHKSSPWFHGFSDHTEGSTAAIVAAGYGVEMIEKHFTLDKAAQGPDHGFSADPIEMADLVYQVRRVEKMLGNGSLGFMPGEQEGREKWRVPEGALRGA